MAEIKRYDKAMKDKNDDKIKYSNFPLTRINFILMAVCGAMIVIGFLLMLGGSNEIDHFNAEMFSTRRIVVGPTISFLGFLGMAFAIIFKKKETVKDYVTNGLDTIGIRIPDDEMILDIIEKLGKPLLVTSANLSNTPSLKNYTDVYDELNGRIDAIVKKDARSDLASTIIDATGENFKVLREGKIRIEEIEEYLYEK